MGIDMQTNVLLIPSMNDHDGIRIIFRCSYTCIYTEIKTDSSCSASHLPLNPVDSAVNSENFVWVSFP